jgi:hypothetical protein
LPLVFTTHAVADSPWCIVVTKGGATLGEIRRGPSIFRYYPARDGPLDPPALEDPDLESLKKRIADHLSAR